MSQDLDPASAVTQVDAGFERRVVSLEGGINFRDLGGYRTEDGRSVRWEKLYRSGSMGGLTKADHDVLAALNIRRIIDLRTPEEREAAPNLWAAAAGIAIWSRDYKSTFGVLRELLASDLPTVEAAREAIKAGYRRLPFEHVPAYRALFESLRDGDVPLVFNCSAGKDRAGTAAALLLLALGVPRATIIADYRLTDRLLDRTRLSGAAPETSHAGKSDRAKSVFSRVPPEVIAVVMGTDASYLHGVFDAIDDRYGSITAYVQQELEIDRATLDAIRETLLE